MSQQLAAQNQPGLLMDPAEGQVPCQRQDRSNVDGLLPSKTSIHSEDSGQAVSMKKPPKELKCRFDSSLFRITRNFIDLIRSAPGGVLDLKETSTKLGVPKRRLYDISNILGGANLVQKKSKNLIQWIGGDITNFDAVHRQKKQQEELDELSAMEDALDELIKDCAQQLFELTDDKENEGVAYVTYQDIQSIKAFREQMVIAVKAPAETILDIPDPGEDSITLQVQSTKGPIDVYLLDMKQDHSNNKVSEGGGTSLSKSKHSKNPNKEENSPQQSEEVLEVSK
ncbi:transcription factor E2F6-like [Molossus molossus]|uniref:transcription factor E2F6-like n=1 Tax=Molossus molossus TaxID=27622 RepID=UPI001746C870|nr:transcription factor E2F6-like [Molossus molossus]